MERIGILGGTFDPPHIGHLIIAEEVRLTLHLAEIWFIPSYTPPHKEEAKTSPDHRLEMVRLAIKDNPYFKVNTVELERSGKSYTIDTIKELQKRYLDKEFYFIIGADMVEYLPKWYRIEELFKLVTFVGVKRPKYQLKSSFPIKEVDIPLIEISSTLLRKRCAKGESVNYWLPQPVYHYLKEHHLYGY
jgi:nicotinate-nucleotide adenylyltransferase